MFFMDSPTTPKKEGMYPTGWQEQEQHKKMTRQTLRWKNYSPLTQETLEAATHLLETKSEKAMRIQKWVDDATAELKKKHVKNLEKEARNMSLKRKAPSEHDDLSPVSSDSSLHNLSFCYKDTFASIPDVGDEEEEQEVVEQDEEPQCAVQVHNPWEQGTFPNATMTTNEGNRRPEQRCVEISRANLQTGFFKQFCQFQNLMPKLPFFGSAHTDKEPKFAVRGDIKRNDSSEPQLSSEGADKFPCAPIKYADCAPRNTKVYSGAHDADNVNARIGYWKRKISPDEVNLSNEEKRIKRLQRFADNSTGRVKVETSVKPQKPSPVNFTLDEIIMERNIQYNKPSNNQPVERFPSAPEESEDNRILVSRREPVAQVLRTKPSDDATPRSVVVETGKLRPIVVDGSNVAAEYSGDGARRFDCKGIQVCVNYFLAAGHNDITVVVPEIFLLPKNKRVINKDVLHQLKKEGRLLTCWSRQIATGKYANSYDDRMIVEVAFKKEAVVISNDRYRDLCQEEQKWRETIFNRLLPFRFVPGKSDEILLPKDPNGRYGPTLQEFLQFP